MVEIELMNIFYSNSNQRFPRLQVAITTLMAKGEMRTWDQRKGSKQAEHFPGSQLEKRKRVVRCIVGTGKPIKQNCSKEVLRCLKLTI